MFLGYDYDLYAAPEAHIAFFRIVHGLILTFLIRDTAKKYIKVIIAHFTGPITEHNIRQRNIEVTFNYAVYALTGFTVTFLAPLLFTKLGLYQ